MSNFGREMSLNDISRPKIEGDGRASGTGYLPGLDALRALAIGAVVAFPLGFDWAPGGWLGVSLFFTLSGYLVTRNLLAAAAVDPAGRVRLRTFWAARARRLLPAAWTTLTVVTVVALVAPAAARRAGFDGGDVLAALSQVANWRFLAADASYAQLFASPSPVLHFWSLAVEEQVYVVLPLVVAAVVAVGARRRRALALLAVPALASFVVPIVAGWSVDRVYYGTDARIGEVLVGAALAVVLAARRGSPGRSRVALAGSALPILALTAFAVAVASIEHGTEWIASGLLPAAAVVSVVLVSAAVRSGSWIERVGTLRPVAACGRASYAIYLLHWPLLVWLRSRGVDPRRPLVALAAVVGTVVAAVVVTRVVERPIRRRRLALPGIVLIAGTTAAVIVAGSTWLAPGRTDAEELLASLETHTVPAGPMGPAATSTAPPSTNPPGSDGGGGSATATSTLPDAAVPTARVFGDSIALSLLLATPAAGPVEFVPVDGDQQLGCGVAPFDEAGGGDGPIVSCDDPSAVWAASFTAAPVDAAVILTCQWEAVDRRLDGDGPFVGLGDPTFDEHVAAAYDHVTDVLLDAGAEMVLWVRCPDFAATVGADGLPDRLAASRDPARTAALRVLVDEVAAAHPGAVCTVAFDAWMAPRREDVAIRPDGAHYEWRDHGGAGTEAGQAFARLVADAVSSCTTGPP